MYKARPGVEAVVHAHPYACVMCSILGLELAGSLLARIIHCDSHRGASPPE
jgi:ribulose-5-phosphate 4-epimerase/fuculose-1-phosphate aldolase